MDVSNPTSNPVSCCFPRRRSPASGNCPSSLGRRHAPRASRFTRTMKSKTLRKSAPWGDPTNWVPRGLDVRPSFFPRCSGNFIEKQGGFLLVMGLTPTKSSISNDGIFPHKSTTLRAWGIPHFPSWKPIKPYMNHILPNMNHILTIINHIWKPP